MSQAERIVQILDRLSRYGRVTTKEIMNIYQVSDRQVRRDISYIKERIERTHFGAKVELDYDQYEKCYRLYGEPKELERILSQNVIASAVAASSVNPLKEAFQGVELNESKVKYMTQAMEMPDYSIFFTLMSAIEMKKKVEIIYCRPKNRPFKRVIEPLELINYSSVWYVRAIDMNIRNPEIKTYSLSRIKEVNTLDEYFEFSDYDRLKKIDESGFGIFYSYREEIKEYTMRFYENIAFIVSAQVWHKNQRGRWIDDDTYELTVPAINEIELLGKVLSYGQKAEPIAPPEFVESYKNEIKLMKDRFGL